MKISSKTIEEIGMTVILMLAMFAIFLTIDYVRKGKEARETDAAREEAASVAPRVFPTIVSGFELPENRRYHQGHTWALQESPTLVRVGLDDFGARLAGKIDEISLPKRGQWLRQGQKFATLLRDGQKTDLVSPVEGEVTNVNEALFSDVALMNSDPYGQGWFVSVLSPDLPTSFRNLLNGTLARKWMAEASSRLQMHVPALAGAVAQDGGLAVHDLTVQMPTTKWAEVTREFFLT
jgi:glycine cleavage system H protein